MNPEMGKTYFEIIYVDADCTMPAVRPMVYVGCDIFDEGNSSQHFFQDTESVVTYGMLGEGEGAMVFDFSEQELGKEIVDISDLQVIMEKAYQRYMDCGKPKLVKE